MPTQEDIDHQQLLLQSYRQTLSHWLQQQATVGKAFTSPAVTAGIKECRENIRRVKRILRTWNILIEDMPDDDDSSYDRFEHQEIGIETSGVTDKNPVDAIDLSRLAEREIKNGNLDKASHILQQAFLIYPDDENIRTRYMNLKSRRRIESKLGELEFEFETYRESHSYHDALMIWRKGLQEILTTSTPDLPADVINCLKQLIEISSDASRGRGGLLADDENWEIAENIINSFTDLTKRYDNWLVPRLLKLAEIWANIVRDTSLLAVIPSLMVIGELLEAYRAAVAYHHRHPEDDDFVLRLAEIQEILINSLNISVEKRINRARTALDSGYFEIALENIESIDIEIYKPIERIFPNLIQQSKEILQFKKEAANLKQDTERLKFFYGKEG